MLPAGARPGRPTARKPTTWRGAARLARLAYSPGARTHSAGGTAMRTNAAATFRATMLSAALVTAALTGLAGFAAAADSVDCPAATCPSPVMGPGHHQDVETW